MPSTTANSSTLASSKKQKTGPENLAFTSVGEYVINQVISPDTYKFTTFTKKPINDLLDLQPTKKIPPKLLDLAWDMLSRSISTTQSDNMSETDCTKWIWAIVSAVINYLLDYSNLNPSHLSAKSGHSMSFEADVSEKEGKQVETRLVKGKTDISILYCNKYSEHHLLPIEAKIRAIEGAVQSLLFLTGMDKETRIPVTEKVIFYLIAYDAANRSEY